MRSHRAARAHRVSAAAGQETPARGREADVSADEGTRLTVSITSTLAETLATRTISKSSPAMKPRSDGSLRTEDVAFVYKVQA